MKHARKGHSSDNRSTEFYAKIFFVFTGIDGTHYRLLKG